MVPKIVEFLNLADFSVYTDSTVSVDEPLFEPIPRLIQFTDYEALQIKEKTFKLRNKDKVVRRVKIIQPDSRLFTVVPANSLAISKKGKKSEINDTFGGNKVAPGMEITYIIRFSPESKADYSYDLVVVTEREKFIVPIVAIGKRAMIDFPDTLIKYVTEKPVIIRNLGEKTSKWFLKMPNGFDSDKKEGVLEYGKNEQIVIKFFPTEAKVYESTAVLSYDGLEAYIPIIGKAFNDDIYLSTSSMNLDEAYIGLQTQQTVQLINKSHYKVEFQWRAFKTEKEENEKKQRLRNQLEQEEAEEKMLLKEIVSNEVIREEIDIDDDQADSEEEEKDEKALMLKRQKKAELLLDRKYKNIRKAIDDDMLLFQDDIFTIQPISGQIWPTSEMTITVTFRPKRAAHYSTTAYCNISCLDTRLALTVRGEGKGPKASLTTHDYNIGDIFVTETRSEDIAIENKGEIEAKFELIPNETPFGKMFKFSTERGVLGVGESLPITWTFRSTILSEFSETFKWRLEGSEEYLSILFTGHVLPPSFKFSRKLIDFEKVSFSFQKTESFLLTNTSKVPFKFKLRIPGDEFNIKPASDILAEGATMKIDIEFIPMMARKYDMVLVIDLDGIGDDMDNIVVKGECEVPTVKIDPNTELKFGKVFLRNPSTQEITLLNDSTLRAKYEILPQNEDTKILATYSVDQAAGIIEPNKRHVVNVTLITNTIGEFSIPLLINIVGNTTNNPYSIDISVNSRGPIVELSTHELDFGDVMVLIAKTMSVKIKNKSDINADFNVFTRKERSIFKPLTKHGILTPMGTPGDTIDIVVLCCADEEGKLNDILHFVITEGEGADWDVTLKAKATGSTITYKKGLEDVKLDTMFTHKVYYENITIENKGNKNQTVIWEKRDAEKKKPLPDEKKGGGSSNKKPDKEEPQGEEEPQEDVFTIIPKEKEIPPHYAFPFQIRCKSTTPGKKVQKYQISYQIGKDKKKNNLILVKIEGNYIFPEVIFNQPKLNFVYKWVKGVPMMPIPLELEMTCGSELPINFDCKVPPPFHVTPETFTLEKGKSDIARVDFDPSYEHKRISRNVPGELTINHKNHPRIQKLALLGQLCFPNIDLETTMVNFGAILVETSKKISIKIDNNSVMALNYEWTFEEEEIITESQQGTPKDKKDKERKGIPINEVFDILPLSGRMEPGDTENVEFVFNAVLAQRFKTVAVCHVDGGPDYRVTLQGDSSLINYEFNPENKIIDIGEVRFRDKTTKHITLRNTGKVTFEYHVYTHTIQRKGLFDITPLQGKISEGEKITFTINFIPGMPDFFEEMFLIECAYFEPDQIRLIGRGLFPTIIASLPRVETPIFITRLEEEKQKLCEEDAKALESHLQALEKAKEREKRKQAEKEKEEGGEKQVPIISAPPGGKNGEAIMYQLEAEVDRRFLCDIISKNIQEFTTRQEKKLEVSQVSPQNTTMHGVASFFEKAALTTFTCDFGNVVVNSSPKTRTFKITNVGDLPCDFYFDSHKYKSEGYNIAPERPPRLQKNQSVTFKITYQCKQTKKDVQLGPVTTLIPIQIKQGPCYNLELIANLTIPVITVESLENNTLDFGKVLIGQMKTVYVRFANLKEVMCEWTLSTRVNLTSSEKNQESRFVMNPREGIIQPGGKQTVAVSFTPSSEKIYGHKFVLKITDNQNNLTISIKGQGVTINLEFQPENQISIGPVLPYDNFSYSVIEIKNPSDYDTELYSLEFDNQYLKEESELQKFEEFQTGEPLNFNVRNANEPFWNFVLTANQKKLRREEIELKLKELSEAEPAVVEEQEEPKELTPEEIEEKEKKEKEKAALAKELEELSGIERIIEFPKKVEDDVMHHIVVFGPVGVGKTQMVRHLAREHKRGIVNMNEILEWNLQQKTKAAELAEEWLEARKKDMENVVAEREKLIKKAGKKGKQVEEQLGPLNEAPYEYISEEILEQLLQERMESPDCNAGAIFDNLASKNYPDELIALKIIFKVMKNHSVQVVMFAPQKDEDGLEVVKPIEWPNFEKAYKGMGVEMKSAQKKRKSMASTKENLKKTKKKEEEKKEQKKEEHHEIEKDEQPLFDLYYPRDFADEQEEENWNKIRNEMQSMVFGNLQDLLLERLEIPKRI